MIMSEKELLINIDGKFYPKSEAKISVYDHGLLYGDGVFEGIRAYNGVVFKLKEHIDRLYSSAHAILLQIPLPKEAMIKAVVETLKKNDLTNAYIRLVVTRGVGDLGLDPRKCPRPTIIIITDTIKLMDERLREEGVKAAIVWVRRDAMDATPRNVKSLNYLNHVLGKIEANLAGADEGICLGADGSVCEGIAENIFIVKDGVLLTPTTCTGALPGITRKEVMKWARKLNYEVVEKIITPSELFNADESFFTGTAAEIVPIREINERIIGDGRPGSITKRLMEEFKKAIGNPTEGTLIQ